MQWYYWLSTVIGLYVMCGVILALTASREQEGTTYPITVLEYVEIVFIGPLVCLWFAVMVILYLGIDLFNR